MNALPAAAIRRRSAWSSLRGLWAHSDFLRLWTAQSVSLFGSEITVIALPLTAVLVLGAGPLEMGLLAAAGKAPFLLVGLLAGVWVDRVRCRTVLVATDLGRAVLLASIPLAAALGVLRLEQLFVVAFVTGVLTVFFDVAYQSYLPEIVDREQLADANGKLEASRAISEMAGPILGSTLLQLAAAPFAIALDAVSFVVSAGFLRSIATSNEPVTRSAPGRMITEVSEGIRLVLKHPVLRPIAACSATMNLFYQMLMAVFILYMTTELQVPGGLVGVVFGVGSLSGLGGALLASPSARRFGTGRTLLASTLVSSCGALGIAFGPSQGLAVLPWLIGTQLVLISGVPLYNINQLSLRQAITPPGVRGRVNATNRCLVWGTMPVGALLGGFLGHAIGLQPTIAVSGLGMLAAGLWIALSPVRTLDDVAIGQLADLS